MIGYVPYWANEKIAHPMGYEHAVLFPRARDAMMAYLDTGDGGIMLPTNICPQVAEHLKGGVGFQEVSSVTGLARYLPVQLYGYRQEILGCKLEIDPLMTGWGREPICESSIVSFGLKKFISVGYGGAFLTSNKNLADEMREGAHWPFDWGGEIVDTLLIELDHFFSNRAIGFEQIDKWDAALGDLLPRIPMEQVIPWRVMRRVPSQWHPDPDVEKFNRERLHSPRDAVVKALRARSIPVGTNYPPLTGSNKWGDEVINFFPECERVGEASHIISEVLHG